MNPRTLMFRLAGLSVFIVAVGSAQTAREKDIAVIRSTFPNIRARLTGDLCPSGTLTADQFAYCSSVRNLLDPTTARGAFASLVLSMNSQSLASNAMGDPSAFGAFLALAASNRIDVQNGASTNASGTASAVARAGISDVLGLALESGAITQSVNGQAVTLQGNALSLYRFAVDPDNVFRFCAGIVSCETPFEKFLNGLSGAATLNLSNSSTQTASGMVAGTGTGSAAPMSASVLIQNNSSHLTGFSIKYQLHNKLDLRDKSYKAAWSEAFADKTLLQAAGDLNVSGGAAMDWMSTHVDMVNKHVSQGRADLESRMTNPGFTDFDSVINNVWAGIITEGMMNNWIDLDAVTKFVVSQNKFFVVRQGALDKARNQAAGALSIEYNFSRLPNQPKLSTVRLAYTWHPGTLSADNGKQMATGAVPKSSSSVPGKVKNDSAISFNVGADFYNTPPAGTGTVRDVQAALQLDRHFGNNVVTFAGYYQYQNQPAVLQIGMGNLAPGTNIVLPATGAMLLAPKGNIVVAQAMVSLALKNGTHLPLGVTWSNRTELVKGNEVRGHVGFNFDWSSLLAGQKANQ